MLDGAIAITCLALNIYFEARSEPYEGQLAVAMVTLNRSRIWKQDICTTVFEPYQFSWTAEYSTNGIIHEVHRPNPQSKQWNLAKVIAAHAMYLQARGKDPTKGAMYFHADYVYPTWADKHEYVMQIGQHIFYRGNR